MQVGRPPPSPGGHTLRQYREDRLVLFSEQIAKRVGPPGQLQHLLLGSLSRGNGGHDLLRQDVAWGPGNRHAVQPARPYGPNGGGALDQLVPGPREEDSAGRCPQPVPRPAHPLEEDGQRPRRPQVANQIHVTDVDPQLKRRGSHHHLQGSGLQSLLRRETGLSREAAVVGRHRLCSQPLGELVGHALHQFPGVHEDDGGPDPLRVAGNPVVHLRPHGMAGDRAQGLVGHLHPQIQVSSLPRVHDGAIRHPVRRHISRPDQQPPDLLDRPLRRAQPDPLERRARQVFQSLQGEGQVGAPLVGRHGVDLIHDDRPGRRQIPPAALGRQQDIERLRRGDQDVRRIPPHGFPVLRWGVPRPDGNPDLGQGGSPLFRQPADGSQRLPQVLLDVVGKGLQGGNVDDRGLVPQAAARGGADQAVNRPQECRQRLPGARGGAQQRVASRRDRGPALFLRRTRPRERPEEPVPDERMK